MTTTIEQVQLRRGTAATWVSSNPVLAAGEPGYETDSGLWKFGDGVRTWTNLRYAGARCVVDTPEAHGAKRDGKTVIDAAMGSIGSGVLTSATASFVAGDVGKTIMVNGAGADGVRNVLITTIASRQSSTQVTLTATASHTVSSAIATYGTDDTAAINAAIANVYTLAQADKSNYAEIWFSAGIYMVAGALSHAQSGNAQIPVPTVAATSPKFTLALKGSAAGGYLHWLQTTPNQAGTALVSALFPAYSGTYGPPSVIGGPTGEQGYGYGDNGTFSNTRLVVDGLTVVMPVDHTQHGIDCGGMLEAQIVNMAAMVNGTYASGADWYPAITPSSGLMYSSNWGACGLVMPSLGDQDVCNIGTYAAEGLLFGIALGEHTHADSVRVLGCRYGLTVTWTGGSNMVNHLSDVVHYSAEQCQYHIYSPNASGGNWVLNIGAWDLEEPNVTYHIYDAAGTPGCLRGQIHANGWWVDTWHLSGGDYSLIDMNENGPGTPASTPGVPGSGSAYLNVLGRPAWVEIHCGAGVTISAIVVDGTTLSTTVAANGTAWVPVPSFRNITLTYSGGTPTWKWLLM